MASKSVACWIAFPATEDLAKRDQQSTSSAGTAKPKARWTQMSDLVDDATNATNATNAIMRLISGIRQVARRHGFHGVIEFDGDQLVVAIDLKQSAKPSTTDRKA
jgi:hypothetical protein